MNSSITLLDKIHAMYLKIKYTAALPNKKSPDWSLGEWRVRTEAQQIATLRTHMMLLNNRCESMVALKRRKKELEELLAYIRDSA